MLGLFRVLLRDVALISGVRVGLGVRWEVMSLVLWHIAWMAIQEAGIVVAHDSEWCLGVRPLENAKVLQLTERVEQGERSDRASVRMAWEGEEVGQG